MDKLSLDWFENVEARPHPWTGLNWLTPMLYVPNVREAIQFYHQVFGFVPIFELPLENSDKLLFARMRYRGCNFTLNDENNDPLGKSPKSGSSVPMSFYLYVDSVETVLTKLNDYDCKIIDEPRIEFWGDQRARVFDPYGYVWDIAKKV